MKILHEVFSSVCGMQHTWVIGGEELPFCQRCTGLYAGALPALVLYQLCRPKATNRMLWVHGMFLLIMLPFGYHMVEQTGEVRMLTGQLFAWGLIGYLTLLPADRLGIARELSRRSETGYFALGGLFLLCLQAAVRWGAETCHTVLSWLGFVGLLLYIALVFVNAMLLSESAWDLVCRQTNQVE